MKLSIIYLCSSLTCSSLIALGPSLKREHMNSVCVKRGNMNSVCVMHSHRPNFADEKIWHVANLYSDSNQPTDQIRKALDDKMKIVNTHHNVDEIVGKSAGRTDVTSMPRSQSELRSNIDQIFSSYNSCNRLLFEKFIMQDLQRCNTANTARFMRLAGKKSRRESIVLLKKHLPLVAKRLQALTSSSWTYTDISSVIYGLQCLGEKDDKYLKILSTMTEVINVKLNGREKISSRDVASMLVGLQRNTDRKSVV